MLVNSVKDKQVVMPDYKLLLATESPRKIELLKRLQVPFQIEAAAIDEFPFRGENTKSMTERLAMKKAKLLSGRYPLNAILATDQSASISGHLLNKPETIQKARSTLRKISGQTIIFYTSAIMIFEGTIKRHTEETIVKVRRLEEQEIIRYIDKDQPLNCSGAFKVESLGISLFQSIESNDPTALEGLPLIQVAQWLREIGWVIP